MFSITIVIPTIGKSNNLLKSLNNFLEKTFVPQSESDTGLFIRIDRSIANSLLPI